MSSRKFSFSTAAAVIFAAAVLGPAHTFAADLDPALEDAPQVIPQQLIPQTNVVFGSGWYVRGDVAATDDYDVVLGRPTLRTFSDGVRSTQSPTYNFSLGGGYAFTNHFRADLLADFFHPSQNHLAPQKCLPPSTSNACELVGTFNHYDALANGYYDIGTWSIVTPYIGVGAGVGFGNVQASIIGGRTTAGGYIGYHNFAFAGMAGLSFDVYPHVKVDVGYRYVNNGKVAGTEIYNHEVRAGLRYMIDN